MGETRKGRIFTIYLRTNVIYESIECQYNCEKFSINFRANVKIEERRIKGNGIPVKEKMFKIECLSKRLAVRRYLKSFVRLSSSIYLLSDYPIIHNEETLYSQCNMLKQ